MSKLPGYPASVDTLRRIFNNGEFEERVQNGELRLVVGTDRHRSNPNTELPYCTQSQIVNYIDSAGKKLATAHRFILPDGTLGGSGRPDPKRIWLRAYSLYLDPEADNT